MSDDSARLRSYERAFEDSPSALLADKIARCHRDGAGTTVNWKRALQYYQRACEGNASSCLEVAWCHYWGLGTTGDPSRAAVILEEYLRRYRLFDHGVAHLALAAQRGEAGVKLLMQAGGWLLPAALLIGHAKDAADAAQFVAAANQRLKAPIPELALDAKALWARWRRAWHDDDPDSQLWVARFLRHYVDREANANWWAEEMRWLRRAADAGVAEAQFRLGDAMGGFGTYHSVVAISRDRSLEWIRLAAAQGHQEAIGRLDGSEP